MMNLKYYLRGLGTGIVVTALIMGIAASGKKQALTDDEIRERARELGMVEESNVLADTAAGQSANAEEKETDKSNTSEASTPPEKTARPEGTPEKTPSEKNDEASAKASAQKTAEPSPVKTPEPKEKTPAPSTKEMTEQEPPLTLTEGEENTAEDAEAIPSPSDPGAENAQTVSPVQTPEQTPAPADETPKAEAASQSGSIQVNSGESSYTVSVKLQEAGLVSSASEFDRYLYQNGYDKRIRTGVFEIPAGADAEEIAKIITRKE